MRKHQKDIFLSILSAILLILSFPKAELGFCAWFALIPWFFALQKKRPIVSFFLSYLVGIVFFGGIVYWVNFVSRLGFLILILYLAMYFAVFGLAFSLHSKKFALSKLLVVPCAWVALEYIRSQFFTGFAWALLGYSQYSVLPLIQISDITGAYGVSFLLVLVNVGIWLILQDLFKSRAKKKGNRTQLTEFKVHSPERIRLLPLTFCLLSSLILVLSYGYFRLYQKPKGKNIKISVVQGNIPQRMKWDPQAYDFILHKYFYLTKQSSFKHPRIIIWPETSLPGYLESEPKLLQQVCSLSKKISPAYLLIGTPHIAINAQEQEKLYNSATLLFQGRIVERYDKVHLVPFGEFIPWPKTFARFSFASLISNFSPGKDYTVFSLSEGKAEIKLSTLICFEDIFGHLARRFVQRGARVLVNMTNDAWFKDSSEPYQHLQASVFRAIENRVNLVRSANTGISCFIDPWGRILSRVADEFGRFVYVEAEITQNLNIVSMSSFYTAFGDIFAWLCLFITSGTILPKLLKMGKLGFGNKLKIK